MLGWACGVLIAVGPVQFPFREPTPDTGGLHKPVHSQCRSRVQKIGGGGVASGRACARINMKMGDPLWRPQKGSSWKRGGGGVGPTFNLRTHGIRVQTTTTTTTRHFFSVWSRMCLRVQTNGAMKMKSNDYILCLNKCLDSTRAAWLKWGGENAADPVAGLGRGLLAQHARQKINLFPCVLHLSFSCWGQPPVNLPSRSVPDSWLLQVMPTEGVSLNNRSNFPRPAKRCTVRRCLRSVLGFIE